LDGRSFDNADMPVRKWLMASGKAKRWIATSPARSHSGAATGCRYAAV
jgi:hypothetical protein